MELDYKFIIQYLVSGIFRYYLSTRYTDEAYINSEVDKCDDHIRRKISDLRKKSRSVKRPSKKNPRLLVVTRLIPVVAIRMRRNQRKNLITVTRRLI